MQTLTRAHDELFRRSPDERFGTLSGKLANAGERSEVDQKASALLSLAK